MFGYALLIEEATKSSGGLCAMLDETGWLVFPARSVDAGLSLLARGWVPDVIVVQRSGVRAVNRETACRLRAVCDAPLFFMSTGDV